MILRCTCFYLAGNQTNLADDAPAITFHDEVDCKFVQSESGYEAMIGLEAMKRANSTLEDFVSSFSIFKDKIVHKPGG